MPPVQGRQKNQWNEFLQNCAKGTERSVKEIAAEYRRRKEVLRTILVKCEAPISPEQIEVLHLNLQQVSKKFRAGRDQSKVENGDRDRNQRHGE